MEVVVKENIANKPMHNGPFVLGVIQAPDKHYEPVLYSHYKATKDFNKLNEDIFVSGEKYNPIDRKKTPASVFCTLGAAALFVLYKTVKHLIKK